MCVPVVLGHASGCSDGVGPPITSIITIRKGTRSSFIFIPDTERPCSEACERPRCVDVFISAASLSLSRLHFSSVTFSLLVQASAAALSFISLNRNSPCPLLFPSFQCCKIRQIAANVKSQGGHIFCLFRTEGVEKKLYSCNEVENYTWSLKLWTVGCKHAF